MTRPSATLTRAVSYFRPYWPLVLVGLLCVAATALLGLVPALVTRAVVDSLTRGGGAFARVASLVAAGVGALLASNVVEIAQTYLSTRISQGIMFDLRGQLFDRLLGQPVEFFTETRTGDVMSRMSNDIGAIQGIVSETAFGLATNLLVAASTLALMLALDWRLTLLSVSLLPIAFLPARRVGRAVFRASQRTQAKLGELTAYVQEVLGISGILLVKSFVTEACEAARFAALNRDVRRLEVRQELIARLYTLVMGSIMAAGPALLWLVGGYLVLSGRTTLGSVVVFVTLLAARLGTALGQLANVQVRVMRSLAVFQRLFEYLDLPVESVDRPGARSLVAARGAVAFEDVTFGYRPDAAPALAGVSFRIEPGQLVALVGPSGAGKTTVTRLLARLHAPCSGVVSVDGHDVWDLTLPSLRGHLGMVFQDTFLFHASIRDNLRFARPRATDAEIERAAAAAHVHELIRSLPEGYDTVVGERGHRLSGGEKQRLAIARVILKDPRILVLDEATSNLDSLSEHLVQSALGTLFAGRTSLVIAHRLSTVLTADLILVLDGGRIVERGRHGELLRQGGLYRTLCERQFQFAS